MVFHCSKQVRLHREEYCLPQMADAFRLKTKRSAAIFHKVKPAPTCGWKEGVAWHATAFLWYSATVPMCSVCHWLHNAPPCSPSLVATCKNPNLSGFSLQHIVWTQHTPAGVKIWFHLKRFFSAYVSEVKKVYFMSRSFTEPAFSRTATNIVKQLTTSTQNTFTFQNCHSYFLLEKYNELRSI